MKVVFSIDARNASSSINATLIESLNPAESCASATTSIEPRSPKIAPETPLIPEVFLRVTQRFPQGNAEISTGLPGQSTAIPKTNVPARSREVPRVSRIRDSTLPEVVPQNSFTVSSCRDRLLGRDARRCLFTRISTTIPCYETFATLSTKVVKQFREWVLQEGHLCRIAGLPRNASRAGQCQLRRGY